MNGYPKVCFSPTLNPNEGGGCECRNNYE
jgi:hypothetical protein